MHTYNSYMINNTDDYSGGKSLVLPAETEERVKRRALNACQDNLRKVVDVSRKIPQLVEYFASGDKENARRLFSEIKAGEEEVSKHDAWSVSGTSRNRRHL